MASTMEHHLGHYYDIKLLGCKLNKQEPIKLLFYSFPIVLLQVVNHLVIKKESKRLEPVILSTPLEEFQVLSLAQTSERRTFVS